jgi:hypothetical protein
MHVICAPHHLARRLLPVRALAPAGVLLGLALLATGCSSTLDKATYLKRAGDAGRGVQTAMNLLSPTTGHQPTDSDLRKAADALDGAANRLNDLGAPADAKAPQGEMVRGLHEMATSFRRLAGTFANASSDGARAQAFLSWSSNPDAQRASADIEQAREDYRAHGYDVFASGA